jgi:hypothetical protein
MQYLRRSVASRSPNWGIGSRAAVGHTAHDAKFHKPYRSSLPAAQFAVFCNENQRAVVSHVFTHSAASMSESAVSSLFTKLRSPKGKFVGVVVGLLGLLAINLAINALTYRYDFWQDTKKRPWAYSFDPSASLLVGRWQGAFVDADGVGKKIELSVTLPKSEDERRQKLSSERHGRSSGGTVAPNAFRGEVVVTGPKEINQYSFRGEINATSPNEFTLHFEDRDGTRSKRGFLIHLGEAGSWKGDALSLTLGMALRTPEGGITLSAKRLPRGSGRQILKEEKGPMVFTDTTVVSRIPVAFTRVVE